MVINGDRKSFGSRRPKKFQKLLRRLAPLTFLIRVQAFRDPLRGEFPHVQIFMNVGPNRSREMLSCSAIDLAEIRRSSKISSWIWSIISGVVTVLGRTGRGASQVEKSPRLNRATSFWLWHTMVSVPLIWYCQNGVNFLRRLALQEKKTLDYSSRLDVVEMARVAWHASFQPL